MGDSHSYEIVLSSNQLLYLLLGKRDTEISIAFLGPNHHKILELRNRFTDLRPCGLFQANRVPTLSRYGRWSITGVKDIMS